MANLPNQIARTLRHLSAQYLVSVLGDPHQVILDVAHRVPAMSVLAHPLILVENRSKLTACKAVGWAPMLTGVQPGPSAGSTDVAAVTVPQALETRTQ